MTNKNDLNELYRILGNLEAGQEAIIDRLERIEVQTTKTNGRVTKLENKAIKVEPDTDGFQQAFSKNLARVGLIMTAVAAAIVAVGNAASQVIKAIQQ